MSTGAGLDGAVTEKTDEMGKVKAGKGRFSGGEVKLPGGGGRRKDVDGNTSEAEANSGGNERSTGGQVRGGEPSETIPNGVVASSSVMKPASRPPSPPNHSRTLAGLCSSAQSHMQAGNLTATTFAQGKLGSSTMPAQQRNGGRKLGLTHAQPDGPHDTRPSSPHKAMVDSLISTHSSATMQPSSIAVNIRPRSQPSRAQDLSAAKPHPPTESSASPTRTVVDGMASLSLKATSGQLPPQRVSAQSAYVPPHRRQRKHDEVVFQPRGTPIARTARISHANAVPLDPISQIERAGEPITASLATREKLPKGPSISDHASSEKGSKQLAQRAPQSLPPREEGNILSHGTTEHPRRKKRGPRAAETPSQANTNAKQKASRAPAQGYDQSLSDRPNATSGNPSNERDQMLTIDAARYGDFDPVLFNKTYLPKAHLSLPPRPGFVAPLPRSRRPFPTQAYLEQADLPIQPHVGSPRSLLVVLDLNGTVCHRKRTGPGKFTFIPRPGVIEFLDYLIQNHRVLVWSSARPENVAGVCTKLFDAEQLVQLVAVWGRDTLRLTPQEYDAKVQVYKQLSWLWDDSSVAASSIGDDKWGQHNTVLIDDSLLKASSEPHNLIQIEEFDGKTDETDVDVLDQVVEYLEMVRMTKDVSAVIKKSPYVYKMSRVE